MLVVPAWLEHAGEPIAFGTVLQLVTATSKAHPPAQGPPLRALPTRSTLGQGAFGETEAQSTLVTKPLLNGEAITKSPVGAQWKRTRRPQELLAAGPTRQGAAFPLPAPLQHALERVPNVGGIRR